ncbi:uncharacterized protein ACBR49_005117 [Aulostomus maculatus]
MNSQLGEDGSLAAIFTGGGGLYGQKVDEEEAAVHFVSAGSHRKKPHICSICGRSFSRPCRLKEHCKIHTTEKPHGCSVCGKAFTTDANLRAHEKIHIADKPHRCSVCPKSFLKPCHLRKHMRIHVRDGLVDDPARDPNTVSPSVTQTEKWQRNAAARRRTGSLPGNHGDKDSLVITEEDGGIKDDDREVSGLINSDGEEEDWRPARMEKYDCSEVPALGACDGERKHSCPVCSRDCFKASALQKHLRTHSGERPFQCPTCRKSFTQHVHMTEHQRTHTGEKPYTCPECSKSFTFSSALRRHQRLHTDARPYQCPICHKTFKQQSSLKSHQQTHSGIRYQCPVCSKSFSRPLELNYHVGMHADTRPYFCDICKKNLSGARIFRKHMKRHDVARSLLSPQPAETI